MALERFYDTQLRIANRLLLDNQCYFVVSLFTNFDDALANRYPHSRKLSSMFECSHSSTAQPDPVSIRPIRQSSCCTFSIISTHSLQTVLKIVSSFLLISEEGAFIIFFILPWRQTLLLLLIRKQILDPQIQHVLSGYLSVLDKSFCRWAVPTW